MVACAIASPAVPTLGLLRMLEILPFAWATGDAIRVTGAGALALGVWSLGVSRDRWRRWRRLLAPLAICLAMETAAAAVSWRGGREKAVR